MKQIKHAMLIALLTLSAIAMTACGENSNGTSPTTNPIKYSCEVVNGAGSNHCAGAIGDLGH